MYKTFSAGSALNVAEVLAAIAQDFSPRYERHRDDLVSIDVGGLGRLVGTPRTIGEKIRRVAAARGVRVHVALAATRMAALVLAQGHAGLAVVEPGGEAEALASLPIGILERIHDDRTKSSQRTQSDRDPRHSASSTVSACKRWGLRTLGDLAALPPGELTARLGQPALFWQAVARGEDVHPLVPTLPEERFMSSLDLDWPIEGIEPLSFALTRLLEPLSTRLERRDRGAAVLHVELGLVTSQIDVRHLQLPSPIRDVRTLRTLALLDLDAHPPPAAIDRVTIVIDPTPGRVLQHTLFTRAQPAPDRLSTLLARLGALMGHDRIGRPAPVDSYRPGAFEMKPFRTEHRDHDDHDDQRRDRREHFLDSASSAGSRLIVVGALRRCRAPVPARVAISDDRPVRGPQRGSRAGDPVRVTTDRRGFAGGSVVRCAGPWRTSGEWWQQSSVASHQSSVKSRQSSDDSRSWNRDEWDVALNDGAVYRIFRNRDAGGWFIDAIVD